MIYSVHTDTFDRIVVCMRVKYKNTQAVEGRRMRVAGRM